MTGTVAARVSVIVPAFNAAATLAETLKSVRAQDLRPSQIVVVDDGSSDDTGLIAHGFDGVVVMRQENAGVAAAINTGLAAVDGDAIAILDADDLCPPGRLARQWTKLAKASDSDAIAGEVEEFVCPSLDASIAARLIPRPRQTGWLYGAVLLRKRAIDKVGLFEPSLRVGAWVDWMDRAKGMNLNFAIETDLALRRRLRPGTLSSSQSRDAAFLQVARRALARKRGLQT